MFLPQYLSERHLVNYKMILKENARTNERMKKWSICLYYTIMKTRKMFASQWEWHIKLLRKKFLSSANRNRTYDALPLKVTWKNLIDTKYQYYWLIDGLTDWLTDWFDSLIHCLTVSLNIFHRREFHSDRSNINGYVVFKEKECAVKSLKR